MEHVFLALTVVLNTTPLKNVKEPSEYQKSLAQKKIASSIHHLLAELSLLGSQNSTMQVLDKKKSVLLGQ